MYQFLVVVGVLCGCVFSATVETQRQIHGRKIRQAQQTNNGSHSESRPTEMNIAFELPDITTTFELAYGTVQLEAFKSTSNDRILQDATQSKTSQLFWVSIGHPNLVRTSDRKNASNLQLFHFSNRGFNTYIEMLTATHRKALATAARNKYRVNISDDQVVHLILSRFQCTLLLYDEAGGKFLLSGNIFDFRHFPHRMDFDAPPNSIERRLFSKVIAESEDDLHFDCHIESSGGKVIKTNILTISTDQLQQIGLEEKLFGPVVNSGSNEVYVSRNQMYELAHEMYSTLNIAEDYQMPETQFNEGFVNDIISQLSLSAFAQVPIDTVLASLSKYGFDIGVDIQPDVIKRDIGSVLKVEKYNNRSHIVLNESRDHQGTYSDTSSGKARGGFWTFKASADWAIENKETDKQSDRSLSDQLRELNAASNNEIKWDFDGNRVVPKSLNVARLTRSKLRRTLTFNRIRVQTFDSPFQRNFKLYADRSAARKSMEENEGRDWKLQIQNFSSAMIRAEEAIQSMSQHLNNIRLQTILVVSEGNRLTSREVLT